jgi:hypothetical protein
MTSAAATSTRPSRLALGRLVVMGWIVGMAACHHPPPTAPGPARVSLEGTWSGTFEDRTGLVSRVSMSLAGIEPTASGTFTLSFDDSSMNASGIVLGSTVDAPAIHLTFYIQQAGPQCTGIPGVVYHARVALNGNTIDGDYEPAFGCDLLTRGAVRLTRR